ncbi:unnamed protein product, partial [Cuscuta campestris]
NDASSAEMKNKGGSGVLVQERKLVRFGRSRNSLAGKLDSRCS